MKFGLLITLPILFILNSAYSQNDAPLNTAEKPAATVKQKQNSSQENQLLKTNIPVSNVLDQSAVQTDEKLTLELFSYEDFIYTGSRKTQVGDQTALVSRFRYQITDSAWTSLGFRTDPDKDRFDNKTSDFELRAGYLYENLVAQADFSFNTNDPDGGISFGFDLDSENTFLRYVFNDKFQLTFFPFNFDGDVGVDLSTGDITRIYYVQGTPTNVPIAPDPDDPAVQVAQKTIPGFELRYNDVKTFNSLISIYAGIGAASYEYPNDPNFDIFQQSTGSSWSRKEAVGYKAGVLYRRPYTFTSLQYVGQTGDDETGVLLKSAASLYSLTRFSKFITEFEFTASEGGDTPYRINRQTLTFDVANPAQANPAASRVYADLGGNLQDWTSSWGYGASLKVGLAHRSLRPYLSYRYLNEDFVYQSRISAHNLRTVDFSESHGGLHGLGFGAFIYNGNFIINPRFEYLLASNDVFAKSSDIVEFDTNRNLTDQDFSFFVNVSYFFNNITGPRTFRL